MTTLALPLDRTRELAGHVLDSSVDHPVDMSLDLSVVTIESLVARDISAYTERNRRAAHRALVR